jgi:hypothetical protein
VDIEWSWRLRELFWISTQMSKLAGNTGIHKKRNNRLDDFSEFELY